MTTSDLRTTYRFNVDDYHRMGEAGIFDPESRLELIEGEIICMSPIGNRHAWCVYCLTQILVERLQRRAVVSIQNPVRLSRHSEPQPDLAILRSRAGGYRSALPEAGDTLLIFEVSDSTLRFDHDIKLKLYAKAAIPEVWIVDLSGERVLTFTGPSGDVYLSSQSHQRGATLSPAAFADITLTVDEILG